MENAQFNWWQLLGIPIIGVNIARLVWMADDWYQILWLSQWIGTFQGFIILFGLRSRWCNGLYLYLGFLPCVAFFLNLFTSTDLLFYLNHAPHIMIFYFLKHPEKIDVKGSWIGLIFVLTHLNMTFYLGYIFEFQSVAVNTTTHILFPIVLGIIVAWYFFLEWFIGNYEKKQSEQIFKNA